MPEQFCKDFEYVLTGFGGKYEFTRMEKKISFAPGE